MHEFLFDRDDANICGGSDCKCVLRDAVPVCAGDVMGASVAVVMTVDAAKVAVKQLSARNAVSETRTQTERLFQSNCSSPANCQCGPSCKCSSCDDNSCCQCTCIGCDAHVTRTSANVTKIAAQESPELPL